MKTLDDAWNSQEWETFKKRHAENVAVYWHGQPEPTRGRLAHHREAVEFFKTIPDNRVENNPYKILFGQGDYTCSVAEFTGTMKMPDGKTIPPTNKKFRLEFCTVAHWKNGEIVEERLFYDLVGMMKQLGIMRAWHVQNFAPVSVFVSVTPFSALILLTTISLSVS